MPARRLFLVAAFSLTASAPLALPPQARAQELSQPEVANSKYSFIGGVNSNSVHVRSGPSDNYYATMRLDKGAKVTVVGIKNDWLKIKPPAGSYSYVAKAFVQRRGDGKIGRVTDPLNVRAGSELNAMKTTVQAKLDKDADVTILGEQDEYFKIEPPEGTHLYVHKTFVNLIGPVPNSNVAQQPAGEKPEAEPAPQPEKLAGPGAEPAPPGGEGTNPAEGPEGAVTTATPQSPPATQQGADAENGEPTTKAAPESAEAKFDKLEAEFAAASAKPVLEQPLPELLSGYQALVKTAEFPESMRRVCDARVVALQVRTDTRTKFEAVRKRQEEMLARQQSLKVEGEELRERIKENEVTVFTAVGTLRTSSLQTGREVLYRLTDPQTGRTVVYLRSNDNAKLVPLLNQFIGVRGSLGNDPQLKLKVIAPTEAQLIEASKVNGSVIAQVVPPSLLPKSPTLTSGAQETAGAVEPQ